MRARKEEADIDNVDVCMEFRCSESSILPTYVTINVESDSGESLTCPVTLNPNTPDFKSFMESLGNQNFRIPITFKDALTYGERYGMERNSGINVLGLCKTDLNTPQCVDPDVHCANIQPAMIVNCP